MSSETFLDKHKAVLDSFYAPYFDTEAELQYFLIDAFDLENGSLVRRQMINQVQRFISLADDIEKLRPWRDGLRVLFIKICLESLHSLSAYSPREKARFYAEFISCFSEEGQKYILENFHLTSFDDGTERILDYTHYELTLDDFFEVIKAVRDKVVHEGVYWETQFFARDDSTWLTVLETDSQKLKCCIGHAEAEGVISYSFETTLEYKQFVFFFVQACVRFISSTKISVV